VSVDELIDGWQTAWTGRDPDAFGEVCLPEVHYEDPFTDEPLDGLQELTRHAARLWAAFPDARLEQTGARLSDGRFLAAPCKLLGTNREPLESVPPTNRFIVIHCIFYCEIARGQLLRVRAFFDAYDAATQLGILPARGTLGEKALLVLRGFGLRAAR
jgi:steroid delta-isomerase-like uncharacterized protein